ncbi:MAG TPA: heparan-alpha-glucosaminide N-acetyltransferase [Ramlibacter sp.]|nr:heparan-alpha-glucosaminide N-acetyltransferase [Ramlibacter sp.]
MPIAQRYDAIDTLRGAAIVWMTAFHFGFDLNHFGWIRQDFLRDPIWTGQRTAIVSLFLFCAGLGQAMAVAQRQAWPRFWRRWSQIAACAVLVTAGSTLMFPRSFIYFGVLHGIAVMLVLARLSAGWGRWLWPAGALALLLPAAAALAHARTPALDFLNQPGWNVLGLVSRKPVTEDYVPLLPWKGVMWWGVAAGQALLRRRPLWLAARLPGGTPLAWLGRWSLSWYMLHQPVLIGLVAATTWLLR